MATTQISVIGSGSWGTALAILLCQNLDQVKLWGRRNIAELSSARCNQQYLPGIPFPANLQPVAEFTGLIDESLNFLLVVPSHAFRQSITRLYSEIIARNLDPGNSTILWGTKGFDPETGLLPGEVVSEIFPPSTVRGCVSGPSFAKETAAGLPTALTLASHSQSEAERLSAWFRTTRTRVYFSDDLTGVQLGAAIKNVMAIATGISDGLGYGANARAALITRGLAEMIRLGVAMGGKAETFNGLTGVGDLILSCTDDQSRNRRFGLGIGAGQPPEQVTAEIGQEIEGIQTTRELYNKAARLGVEMPITEQVYQVLYQQRSPSEAVQSLLGRDPRAEHSR